MLGTISPLQRGTQHQRLGEPSGLALSAAKNHSRRRSSAGLCGSLAHHFSLLLAPGFWLLAPLTFHFPPFTFHRFYRMRVWWNSHNRLTPWLLAGLLGLFGACSRPSVPCTNVVSSEEISPSGKFKAVVFHRSCQEWVGSTVTTNVSILPANQSPGDGNGNVMSYKGEVGVRAGWLSEQRLAIYSFADLNDSTRLDTVGGVTIEYPHMVDADIVRPAASPVPSVRSSARSAAEGAK